jgi:hypothetical protein
MAFSAYDSKALRELSSALAESLGDLQRMSPPFSEERSQTLKRTLTARLMSAYDTGVREPLALKRAALEGFSFAKKDVFREALAQPQSMQTGN